MRWIVRWRCGPASGWTVMMSAPASANASRSGSTGEIIRWTSKGLVVCGRNALTTAGPIVMFGTKWPSITSTWIQSAPAASIARTSSPRRAKSAERIEGAIRTGCCMTDSLACGSRAASYSGGAAQSGDEEAITTAFVCEHPGQRPDPPTLMRRDALGQLLVAHRIDRELRLCREERHELLLALGAFER